MWCREPLGASLSRDDPLGCIIADGRPWAWAWPLCPWEERARSGAPTEVQEDSGEPSVSARSSEGEPELALYRECVRARGGQ